MSERTDELKRLCRRFGGDTKALLTEYPALENLRVFSDRREGLLEWFSFRKGASLLQAGSGAGSLTRMLLEKGLKVTVQEEDPELLDFVKLRFSMNSGTGAGAEASAPEYFSGALGDIPAGRRFDYILFDGTLKKNDHAAVAAAKRLLAAGGVLIVAADNSYGVRAFAGAEREENSMSREALESLLLGGGNGSAAGGGNAGGNAGSLTRYYVEPMRALPSTIYSDRRLPEAGELSRVIPAYGFPAYLAIDIGAKYDEVCRDGVYPQFADAFLFFWTAGAPGRDQENTGAAPADSAVFVKYNRNRREEYQLKTVIRETGITSAASGQTGAALASSGQTGAAGSAEEQSDPGFIVEKSALGSAGIPHIRDFEKRYRILCAEQEKKPEEERVVYAEPCISEDGKTASFPWITGESFGAEVTKKILGGAPLVETLEEAFLRVLPEEAEDAEARKTAGVHNLDSILDNFLLSAETAGTSAEEADTAGTSSASRLSGIDYEWVTEQPADRGFVKYRALISFYEQNREVLSLGSRAEFLQLFGIGETEADRFAKMEEEFQQKVAGDDQSVYLDRFVVEVRDGSVIEKTERDLRIANERLQGFRAELREKETTIRKMTEVKRLTDNHVTNLEIIIQNLRHENNELGKTLTYLDKHQTALSRLRRKAGDAFNRKYPKGSRERKELDYKKDAVLHPLRHRKMISTPEGRNLIEGDFAIGDIYKEHGKLKFPKVSEPLVSVILPVYNQIGYTYACLVSLLEHPDGIPFEVIIADDVSTDATKNLDHFAEGLVISRNTVNQGFLRNCNQAAKKARGKYLFFLNNDTKVNEGWCKWLVKLLEEDPSIGMTGSKLVYPDGRLQEAGGIIWSDASGWNYGRLQNPDLPEFNYVKDVDYISGAAIMIRRSLWEEIGGFDERYAPAYCEDSDLAFEVRKHGYRVVYQPKSVITHFEGVSNGTDVQGTGLKRYQVENTEKLKEKWKAELAKQSENTGNPDPFRARERSQGKKILLVVDHYVPTYDRDAGSRTTWQYIRMFLKQGYVVKFLGDNFAHEEPYTTELTQMGVEVLYGQEMQAGIWEWIEHHEKDLHLVYLNRPHIATKYIDFIQSRTHLKVIYYGHDLHFLRERREYELTGDREHKESSEYWKTIELSLMHKADMSYYPSEVECAAIHRLDRNIPVKAITAYLWDEFPENTAAEYEKREGLLFVGGFAHPPNADAVLWFVKEIWPKVREGWKKGAADASIAAPPCFYVVGSRAPEEILQLHDPENGIIIKGFVSDEELRSLYQSCRIVTVPLRYGAGVKGKVVEALYYGAPVVTTSVGAEGIPEASSVMRIADDAEAFADQILELYGDTASLAGMQRKAEQYIRRHFSMENAWKVIEKDFS